ncbi:MAG TPA: hypothetical protein VMR98_01660, partial [Candidatus Polarisedimenticolaceae bacterium]|nr:hypothetical protein [Candidatus Polarisedimenticolaceae bacterium]
SAFATLPFTGSIFIILFWGILAVLVYITGLVIINVLIDTRNSVVVLTEFTKPVGTKGAIFNHLFAQVGAGLVLISLLAVCGLVIFPLLIQAVGVALWAGFSLSSVALGIGAICGVAAALYLIWSLTQVVFELL